jgi:hypothetical protein
MHFLINWKTTASGVALILGAITDVLNQFVTGQWDGTRLMAAYTALMGGIGLLAAKDGNVTGGTTKQPNK